MIVLGNFLIAVAAVLGWVLKIYFWLLIAHVILSWVSPDPRNPIVQFINNVNEPLLSRVRRKIPPIGMIDLSPLLLLLGIYFLEIVLVNSLIEYGSQLKHSGAPTVGM